MNYSPMLQICYKYFLHSLLRSRTEKKKFKNLKIFLASGISKDRESFKNSNYIPFRLSLNTFTWYCTYQTLLFFLNIQVFDNRDVTFPCNGNIFFQIYEHIILTKAVASQFSFLWKIYVCIKFSLCHPIIKTFSRSIFEKCYKKQRSVSFHKYLCNMFLIK